MINRVILAVLAVTVLSSSAVASLQLTVKEIIFASEGGTDPFQLSGTVVAEIDDDSKVLTLTLVNTSLDASSEDASQLLSGVGITLPAGFLIDTSGPGSVKMNGATAHNFVKPADNDVSGEWGYDNNPLEGGWDSAVSAINTGVSSRVSASDAPFSLNFIEDPNSLDGPEFGLWSKLYSTDPGGLNAIEDKVIIRLNLDTTVVDSASFLTELASGPNVLMYGSPDMSTIPEASSVIIWGLLATFGVAFRRRRSY